MNLKNNKTLRDEFAMSALIGLLSNSEANMTANDLFLAKSCYEIADEMMKRREVKNEPNPSTK